MQHCRWNNIGLWTSLRVNDLWCFWRCVVLVKFAVPMTWHFGTPAGPSLSRGLLRDYSRAIVSKSRKFLACIVPSNARSLSPFTAFYYVCNRTSSKPAKGTSSVSFDGTLHHFDVYERACRRTETCLGHRYKVYRLSRRFSLQWYRGKKKKAWTG